MVKSVIERFVMVSLDGESMAQPTFSETQSACRGELRKLLPTVPREQLFKQYKITPATLTMATVDDK